MSNVLGWEAFDGQGRDEKVLNLASRLAGTRPYRTAPLASNLLLISPLLMAFSLDPSNTVLVFCVATGDAGRSEKKEGFGRIDIFYQSPFCIYLWLR